MLQWRSFAEYSVSGKLVYITTRLYKARSEMRYIAAKEQRGGRLLEHEIYEDRALLITIPKHTVDFILFAIAFSDSRQASK